MSPYRSYIVLPSRRADDPAQLGEAFSRSEGRLARGRQDSGLILTGDYYPEELLFEVTVPPSSPGSPPCALGASLLREGGSR
jgi:hypothetical protein